MQRLFLVLCAALSASLASATANALDRPVLVELFTSQGCSSCLPAEEVLLQLTRSRRDVLALGFHIDYRDRLGWKDPFSSPAATARRRLYAKTLGTDQVYTPQLVVEGRIDVLGDPAAAPSAIGKGAAQAERSVRMRLDRQGNSLSVTIGSGAGNGRVLLVGYDPLHETAVRRGENAGRAVLQANIVRALESAGEWHGRELDLTRLRQLARRSLRSFRRRTAASWAWLCLMDEVAKAPCTGDPYERARCSAHKARGQAHRSWATRPEIGRVGGGCDPHPSARSAPPYEERRP